jgi:glycosyltransferase involved in cell wall biosynthesis
MVPAGTTEHWRLRIVGEGPQRKELEHLAAALQVSDKVDLPGVFEHISAEYAAAAMFVLPSRFEGESNALVEAAAAGLPCIVSSEAESSDGVRRFDAGDVEVLAVHLRDLMSDPNKRRSEGDRARESFGDRTPAGVISSWAAVLDSHGVIGSMPGASASS